MGQIKYTISKDEALDAVKEAVSSKFAIMKDNGFELKVGAPMVSATIKILDGGIIELSGNSTVASTCQSAIGMQLKKIEKEKEAQVSAASGTSSFAHVDSELDIQLKSAKLLKAIKELYDLGVIDEELYNAKKEVLLNNLKSDLDSTFFSQKSKVTKEECCASMSTHQIVEKESEKKELDPQPILRSEEIKTSIEEKPQETDVVCDNKQIDIPAKTKDINIPKPEYKTLDASNGTDEWVCGCGYKNYGGDFCLKCFKSRPNK